MNLTQQEQEYLSTHKIHNIRTGRVFYGYEKKDREIVDRITAKHPELKEKLVLIDGKIY